MADETDNQDAAATTLARHLQGNQRGGVPSQTGAFPVQARRARKPAINLAEVDANARASNAELAAKKAAEQKALEEKQTAADDRFLPGDQATPEGDALRDQGQPFAADLVEGKLEADDRPERQADAKPPEIDEEKPNAEADKPSDWPDETAPEPPEAAAAPESTPATKATKTPAKKAAKKAAKTGPKK
jgi:hypothetical protein